jgi:group I intron endonuclease
MSGKDCGEIYIIKNFSNGKYYIGQTTQTSQERFSQHIREATYEHRKEYNYCLSRAIRKYGKEAFDFAILADNVPIQDLDIVESHYIDMYNTTDPRYGYNMSTGMYDTSNFQDYRDIRDDEEDSYEEISDDEINDILAEF